MMTFAATSLGHAATAHAATGHAADTLRAITVTNVGGGSLKAWIIAIAVAVLAFLVASVVLRVVRRVVDPRAEKSTSAAMKGVGAALGAIHAWLLLAIALAVAVHALHLEPRATFWLHLLALVLIGIQLTLCINAALVAIIIRATGANTPVPVMVRLLAWACEVVVWISFALLVLSNAGIHITAFLASLGVGGIAVALALQQVLGDLFASIAIGIDKPFVPGEFIMFGSELGTVEKVGVKSTRIASLSGEELAISNSNLLAQLTHNYSRMPERRIVFGFTVPFDTPKETLTEITERTNALIRASERVRFDRGHFIGFAESGFEFQFVYYMLDSTFSLYRDTQQDFNLEIIELLQSLDVEFAVPARHVALGGASRYDGGSAAADGASSARGGGTVAAQ